ncbi:MAG: undecaprenyl-diphosphate phosphatase [Spirochaetales bacterium]|nr:undecaprenyl-diphosphate phosphatase [Spirochaetales bacterium]
MTTVQSILLGILQGVAEFLPISSSGHLLVLRNIMGLKDIPIIFDVLLHIPTLLAVLIIFYKPVFNLLRSLFRFIIRKPLENDDRINLKLIVFILIVTVFTGIIGVGISMLEDVFTFTPKIVGIFFIITGILLIMTRFSRGTKDYSGINFIQATILGIAQGFGVLPGISRSGITISTALFCKIKQEKAGEISFLLSIPAILGAFLLEAKDIETLAIDPLVLTAGLVTCFFVGLLSLFLLLKIIKGGKFYLFSIYLIPAGILTIIFF